LLLFYHIWIMMMMAQLSASRRKQTNTVQAGPQGTR